MRATSGPHWPTPARTRSDAEAHYASDMHYASDIVNGLYVLRGER
jgi:hypothetical protein